MAGIGNNERGNVGGWILVILLILVVAVAAYMFILNRGMLPPPPFLADQPWMSSILPKEEEPEATGEIEVSIEDTLRNQNLVLRGERDAAQARVTALEQQIAEKDRLILERENEIARLRDAINLSQGQNVNNVALIYENMDPDKAAIVLATFSPERIGLILGAMRESKAADILAELDESLAAQVTQIMAGFEGELAEAAEAPTTVGQPGMTGPVVPVPGAGTTGE